MSIESTGVGRSWRRVVFVGAWLAWLAGCGIRLFSAAPLGHDEAHYAVAGRDLLAGDEPRWTYVSPAMEVIAIPGILAGGDERAFRVLPVLFSCVLFALAAYIARALSTPAAGALAIGMLATTTQLVRLSADLLSDIPSTALLVFAAFVIFTELTRSDGPSYRLCLAAPACAAAMYVRYGSCIPIAIVAVVALAGCFRAVLRRPKPVLATLAIFLALMLPHFINAVVTTGSPLGTLRVSGSVPPGFGKGLAKYVGQPFHVFGWAFVAMVPFAFVAAWRSRRNALLLVTAIATILALGIMTFAEPRYVFLSIVIVIVLGAGEVVRLIESRAERTRHVIIVLIGCALAYAWVMQVAASTYYRATRTKYMQATLLAAHAIRDTHPGHCFVLGQHQTQLEWYSGCTAILVLDPYPSGTVFAVRDTSGGAFQPDLATLPGTHVPVLHVPGVVDVIRLD